MTTLLAEPLMADTVDLQMILAAWNEATDRLQRTHEALQAEAESYAKEPIRNDVRESFLLECAISNADEAKALADGAAKLSAACICLADDLLPKLRTIAPETAYQEVFDPSWTKCLQEHMAGE